MEVNTHLKINSSTPGLKLTESKRIPKTVREITPDIPIHSAKEKKNKYIKSHLIYFR